MAIKTFFGVADSDETQRRLRSLATEIVQGDESIRSRVDAAIRELKSETETAIRDAQSAVEEKNKQVGSKIRDLSNGLSTARDDLEGLKEVDVEFQKQIKGILESFGCTNTNNIADTVKRGFNAQLDKHKEALKLEVSAFNEDIASTTKKNAAENQKLIDQIDAEKKSLDTIRSELDQKQKIFEKTVADKAGDADRALRDSLDNHKAALKETAGEQEERIKEAANSLPSMDKISELQKTIQTLEQKAQLAVTAFAARDAAERSFFSRLGWLLFGRKPAATA